MTTNLIRRIDEAVLMTDRGEYLQALTAFLEIYGTEDVVGQAIRIAAHQIDGPVTVGLVDAHGPPGADAVRLEKNHNGPHGLLFLPACADPLNPPSADAFHLLEKCRALIDDGQF